MNFHVYYIDNHVLLMKRLNICVYKHTQIDDLKVFFVSIQHVAILA